MEGERRLKIVLIILATVIFALSYVVGYIVGKEAGFREAQKKFEVERQRLLKTLAQLNPVSRPIESKVLEEKAKPVESSEETVLEKQMAEEERGEGKEEKAQKTEEVEGKEELSSNVVEEKKEAQEVPTGQQNIELKESGNEVQPVEEGNYYLQVGVFRNRANALKFAEKLKDLGFKVKTVFKKNLTIVIVGYYETLQEAKAVKEELAKEKIDSILKRRKD